MVSTMGRPTAPERLQAHQEPEIVVEPRQPLLWVQSEEPQEPLPPAKTSALQA